MLHCTYTEIAKTTPVSDPQEERRLIMRWQKHRDVQARDTLISSHLRFVVTQARRRSRDPERLQDLIAAGNLGLLKAIDKYDLGRRPPTRFLTYAQDGGSRKEIADEDYATSSLVHVPTHRQKAQRKRAKAFQKAVQEHGPDAKRVRKMDPGVPEAATIAIDTLRDSVSEPTHAAESTSAFEIDRTNHLLPPRHQRTSSSGTNCPESVLWA